MKTRSSGFTLIELLVVVAVLGILAAISVVSYQGYIGLTKKKAVSNLLQQISLAQTEYYSSADEYYGNDTIPTACSIGEDMSNDINTDLMGDKKVIDSTTLGYNFCIGKEADTFTIIVQDQQDGSCKFIMTENNEIIEPTC